MIVSQLVVIDYSQGLATYRHAYLHANPIHFNLLKQASSNSYHPVQSQSFIYFGVWKYQQCIRFAISLG